VNAGRRLGIALVLVASGCAVGPDYRRPELPTPPAFRETPEEGASIADLPWWEVFRDDTLVGLIRESLANNRDLAAAAANVETARYRAAVQRGELFPRLDYEADAFRGQDTFLRAPSPGRGTHSDYAALANVFWEVDVWGRIRRASEATRAEMLASEAVRRAVVLSLVSGVAQSWFELIELDRELEIARESVATYQATYDLFERQYRGGVASKLDSLRGEAALAQASAQVFALEQQIVAKENELSVLLGRPAGPIPRGAVLEAQGMPPDVPVGVPALLLERRPDLIEAEETLIASNARIGQALADYFPRIGLTAFAGSVSNQLHELLESGNGLWAAGGAALGPLFTFGQTTYTWHAAQSATDSSRALYEGSVLTALREVSDALTAREKLVGVRAEQERAVAALRESVATAQSRYMGGLSTYLDVLNALQELYPAEFALAQTERDQLLAVVALYRTLGGGWEQAPEAPELPTPLAP